MDNYNTNFKLNKLTIQNFKGISKIAVNFEGKDFNVYGDNGTGKTSLYDAFLWCLFDKDSQGKTSFEVRPLDSNNQPKHKVKTSVEVELLINDQEVTLARISEEKWVKKRGSSRSELTGMSNEYEVNGVPYTKTKFVDFIEETVDEQTFRKITSADYFFSLDKKKMRELLFNMAEDVTDEQIIEVDSKAKPALSVMAKKNYSVDDLQLVIRKEAKKIKDELLAIPARIEEIEESMPSEEDTKQTELELAKIDEQLDNINEQLDLKSDDIESNREKQRQLASIERFAEDKRADILSQHSKRRVRLKEAVSEGNEKVTEFQEKKKELLNKANMLNDRILNLESELRKMRDEYTKKKAEGDKIKEESFSGLSDSDQTCPKCGQDLPEDKSAELEKQAMKTFASRKKERLSMITSDLTLIIERGKRVRADRDENKEQKSELEAEAEQAGLKAQALLNVITKLSKELSELPEELTDKRLNELLADDKEWTDAQKKIKILNKEIISDNSTIEIIKQKSELIDRRSELKQLLSEKDKRASMLDRITELKERNRQLSAHEAKLEMLKDSLERMSRAKAKLKEKTINQMFSYVSFRLQRENLSGGIEDDCEALIKGVPYSTNASRSERIRAGMDVVRAMQKSEGISAVLFVDNAESATHLINDMGCQIIRLIVSESDKKMRWESA